jgi:hypothetical protein
VSAIKSFIKRTAETILPSPILSKLKTYRERREVRNNIRSFTKDCTTQEIFTKIYTEKVWGQSGDSDEFHSGSGSHDSNVTGAYIAALEQFLRSFPTRPDVVDLGCGDFFVGSQIRHLCAGYTACDIVPPLISFNRKKYESLNVDFRVLDLTQDELPPAEVLFLRQVLQHLSNKNIKMALPQISRKYKYLVLTEHLPATEPFTPNLDIPTGPQFRVEINSGIVLTAAPFKLSPKAEQVLCEVPEMGAMIRTTLYTLS